MHDWLCTAIADHQETTAGIIITLAHARDFLASFGNFGIGTLAWLGTLNSKIDKTLSRALGRISAGFSGISKRRHALILLREANLTPLSRLV
jgi:hypothetical protein